MNDDDETQAWEAQLRRRAREQVEPWLASAEAHDLSALGLLDLVGLREQARTTRRLLEGFLDPDLDHRVERFAERSEAAFDARYERLAREEAEEEGSGPDKA